MSEKKIEPTEAMVKESFSQRPLTLTDTIRAILRTALNHPDARGLFTDEDAIRAAHEKGWDDAAQHIYNKGWEGVTALRKANPHRPVQELPTEDGAVIVPAEDFEFIWAGGGRYFARLTCSGQLRRWYGVAVNGGPAWAAFWCGDPETITPGTWKVEGE